MVQNLIFAILFSKLLFRAQKVFYIRPHVPVDIIRVIFIPDFLAGSLKANKDQRKKSLILQYSFAQKTSLILRTSTHFTLKIICSRKNVKNLSHFTDFPANMFGVCLMLQKTFALHHSLMPKKCSLEALLKHISVYFCVSPEENVCFKEKVEKVRFYLVIQGVGETEQFPQFS